MKRAIAILLAIVCVFSMAACGTSAAPAAPSATEAVPAEAASEYESVFDDPNSPEFNLKFATTFNESHPVGLAVQMIADRTKELSKGKINIEVFPSATLGGERDIGEGLQLGTIDFTVSGPILANFVPEYEIMNMPFLFENREHVFAALDGDFGDELFNLIGTAGFTGLGWIENGFYDVMNAKVANPTGWEDFVGLNIRTVESNGFMDGWAAIGANPVPMAATELFTALQNGTVDGICLSINGTYYLNLQDANQVNFTTLNMYFGGLPIICSSITWDKLPAEYQEAIATAVDEAEAYERSIYQDVEAESTQKYLDAGITVTELPADAREEWKEKVVSYVYPKYPDIVTEEMLEIIDSYKPTA